MSILQLFNSVFNYHFTNEVLEENWFVVQFVGVDVVSHKQHGIIEFPYQYLFM